MNQGTFADESIIKDEVRDSIIIKEDVELLSRNS